jgi:hypothetical protein
LPVVDRDALTVAMAVAPGVYARNRLFSFFKDPDVKKAKRRAAVLRGLAQQLSDRRGAASRVVVERAAGRAVVRFRIDSLRFERQTVLSEVEAACLLYLTARAGATDLCPTAEDRALLHTVLRRLATGLGAGAPRPGPFGDLLDDG